MSRNDPAVTAEDLDVAANAHPKNFASFSDCLYWGNDITIAEVRNLAARFAAHRLLHNRPSVSPHSEKIVKRVTNCRECPHRHYYSGGRYECYQGGNTDGRMLPEGHTKEAPIPEWCALENSPVAAPAPPQSAWSDIGDAPKEEITGDRAHWIIGIDVTGTVSKTFFAPGWNSHGAWLKLGSDDELMEWFPTKWVAVPTLLA